MGAACLFWIKSFRHRLRRCRPTFSCLSKRKVTKEKDTRSPRIDDEAVDVPCVARNPAAGANSAFGAYASSSGSKARPSPSMAPALVGVKQCFAFLLLAHGLKQVRLSPPTSSATRRSHGTQEQTTRMPQRSSGPLGSGELETKRPRSGRAQDVRAFSPVQEELSKTPATAHEPGAAGRGRGVSFLLATVSLDKQRKVARAPERRANAFAREKHTQATLVATP